MKKSIISLLVLILSVFTVGTVAFAEVKTELPITIRHKNWYSTVVINSFNVNNISETEDKTGILIEYRIEYWSGLSSYDKKGPEYDIVVKCYDEHGQKIKTIDFDPHKESIVVPWDTAKIKFDSKMPGTNNQSYLYCEYVNVYAPDGRVKTITNLQVPAYTSVGWSMATTMYAPDDNGDFTRTKQVSPFKIKEYEKVGWYTYEEAVFLSIKYGSNRAMADENYNAIFEKIESVLPILRGTEFEKELYTIRTQAMDKWRNKIGAPLACVYCFVDKSNTAVQQVSIRVTNLSYMKIASYKVKFVCKNYYGDVVDTHYDVFYDDNANIDIAEAKWSVWTIFGEKKTIKEVITELTDAQVVEVVYENGTKWSVE